MNLKKYKKIFLFITISIIFINISYVIIPNKVNAQSDPLLDGFWTLGGSQWVLNQTTTVPAQAASLTSIAGFVNPATAHLNSTWDIFKNFSLEDAASLLANKLALTLVQNLTQATVSWINGGFQGQPMFIADPAKLLSDTANQTIGNMILNNPDLNFLCAPFQAQVKIALGLSYPTFAQQITCTLPGILNNVNNAVNSASVNVSVNTQNVWTNWLQTTQNPQDDPIGGYLIGIEGIDAQVTSDQNAKTQELSWGQGALTFSNCYDTYQDMSGATVGNKSDTYIQGTQPPATPTDIAAGGVRTVQHCSVATPGAIITNMLGFQANSAGNMSELQAALGNGVDTILGSLLSALAKDAESAITGGILNNNNSQADQDYTSALANADKLAEEQYANQSDQANTGNVDLGSLLGTGFEQPQATTTVPSVVPGIDTSDPLYTEKYDSAVRLNNLIDSETEYQNDLGITANVLSTGRAEFVTARTCNTGYSSSTTFLRADQIKSNVITNIDGIGYTGNTPIQWNLYKIQTLIDASNKNLDVINTAESALESATNVGQIADAMTPINTESGNFNSPSTTSIAYVKQWLTLVKNNYSIAPCLINIDPALNISTSSLSSGTTVIGTSSQ
jgi:hypothetical protein